MRLQLFPDHYDIFKNYNKKYTITYKSQVTHANSVCSSYTVQGLRLGQTLTGAFKSIE